MGGSSKEAGQSSRGTFGARGYQGAENSGGGSDKPGPAGRSGSQLPECRGVFFQGDLGGARTRLQRLLRSEESHREARALLNKVNSRLASAEKSRAVNQLSGEARELAVAGNLSAALHKIEEALELDDSAPELVDLQQELGERLQQEETRLLKAVQSYYTGHYPAAIARRRSPGGGATWKRGIVPALLPLPLSFWGRRWFPSPCGQRKISPLTWMQPGSTSQRAAGLTPSLRRRWSRFRPRSAWCLRKLQGSSARRRKVPV